MYLSTHILECVQGILVSRNLLCDYAFKVLCRTKTEVVNDPLIRSFLPSTDDTSSFWQFIRKIKA